MAGRLIVGVAVLAACGGPPYYDAADYARTHPARADLAEMALTQGCPVEGAPANHLRKSFGSPKMGPADDSGSALWRFRLDDRSSLDVVVHEDTIVSWDVASRPSSRIAQRNYSWSLAQSRDFPDRAVSHLNAHPEISPRTAFLILRACAMPGLPMESLRASWGTPSRLLAEGDTARWVYGFGVEGQHDVVLLVGDTVRAFQSVGWTGP